MTGPHIFSLQKDPVTKRDAVTAWDDSPTILDHNYRAILSPFSISPLQRAWWSFDLLIWMMACRSGYIAFLMVNSGKNLTLAGKREYQDFRIICYIVPCLPSPAKRIIIIP